MIYTQLRNAITVSSSPSMTTEDFEIIPQFDYTYDVAGRRTAIAKSGTAFGDLSGSIDSYTYNARSELISARREKNGQPIPGFSEDFDYDPIGNRRSSSTYNEKGEAQTSTYEANNLNQYTTRTTPGYAAVRGEADPNAFVSINGNEAYRLGSYYFGSDLFDNTAAGGLANLETYATLAQTAANGDETEDLVSSVTNQVYLAQSPEAFAYDDDGNQTLITTKTGLWRVTYNGENRSILWVRDSDNTTLAMAYDHMGRRRVKNGQRFFYDGYQQIANFHSPTPTQNSNYYIWDCTEFVATRPLAWLCGNTLACYVYDGNKNVSEVFSSDSEIVAHYDYAPFGAVTTQRGESTATNPWRFSCEYADDELGCDYYNYRHYEPVMGRWMSRDPIGEEGGLGLYGFYRNSAVIGFDVLGMKWKIMRKGGDFAYACAPTKSDTFSSLAKLLKLDRKDLDKWAHTSDAEAVLGKFYKIPNLIVFQVGQLLVYPDKVSYSILGVWESANAMLADVYASAGHQVRVENVTEASSVVSALGTDGLYKYYFTGHGGKDACLIIDADYKFWEESEQVVIPGRYTKYGISEMVLQACYSAETPWVTGWLGNVARAGNFTGYAGSVNSSNRQELTKSFGGSGR